MSCRAVCAVLAVVALGATSAVAGPWSQPSGTSNSFTYANGGDLNGYFGDPFLDTTGDTFYFIGANFQAAAANGASSNQYDEVSLDVFANPGLFFSLIRITASGSYSSTGPGSNEVDLSAGLTITELGGNDQHDGGLGDDGRSFQGDMVTNPAFPESDANGDWSGLAVVDMTLEFPVPDDAVHITMSNDVIAISGSDGSAQINLQYQDLALEFMMIPEPASLTLMGFGALAALSRRRRI